MSERCRHERYHDGHHITGKRLLRFTGTYQGKGKRIPKPLNAPVIAWASERIDTCQDCGEDITEFDIHEFMTAEEYVAKHCVTPDPEKEKRVVGNERIKQAEQKLRNHQAKAKSAGQESLF